MKRKRFIRIVCIFLALIMVGSVLILLVQALATGSSETASLVPNLMENIVPALIW